MSKKAVPRKRANARPSKVARTPKAKAQAKPQYSPGAPVVLRNVTRYMEHYFKTTGVSVSRVSVHAWMKAGRLQVDTSTGTPLIVGDTCPQKQRDNVPVEVFNGKE
jgi:hypothetical protein